MRISCTVASMCNDGNVCTKDTCIDTPLGKQCKRAVTNDGDACTYDSPNPSPNPAATGSEICHWSLLDCELCTENPGCDDGISCTVDYCSSLKCVHKWDDWNAWYELFWAI